MEYAHTQRSPLHWFLIFIAIAFVAFGWQWSDGWAGRIAFIPIGGIVFLLSFCLAQLTVQDEGDFLALRYGPIPLFSKRIAFAEITEVRVAKSAVVDGWGIHYVPGRGWTYNLWGRDCAELTLGTKTIRVGSDDVENLVAFLEQAMARERSPMERASSGSR